MQRMVESGDTSTSSNPPNNTNSGIMMTPRKLAVAKKSKKRVTFAECMPGPSSSTAVPPPVDSGKLSLKDQFLSIKPM